MAHPLRLRHITKQWSSHEGTVEYFPNKMDNVQSRSYSQSTRSIAETNTALLQLEHSNNPIHYRSDWKSTKSSCIGLGKDEIKQMNHYRHVRVIERSNTTKDSSKVPSEFDIGHQNDHRFYSAYSQRLVGTHNTRLSFKESTTTSGESNSRFSSQRSSNYQSDTPGNLTVTDFVNQRYRSPKTIETSLLKQNSCESASTNNNHLETMNKKSVSRNLQIDQIKRQKSCEINTYFDTPSTYRPLQEPYPKSHRDSHSSSRKQSFQNAYGNSEVTIGIERLSIESTTSPEYENTNKETDCQDFLSVNRYNSNRMSLSKQRSCESPPVISEEFSYAQKYKIANYRQKSCDSPTNLEDNYLNHFSTQQNNERRSSSYCEDKFGIKKDKIPNELFHSRYSSQLGSSHSNLLCTQPPPDARRQSFIKSSSKKKSLNRQPSMDLRDHRSSENPHIFNEDTQPFREKNSDSINNLDYLSPTRYDGTYSRGTITKQRSCEITIVSNLEENNKTINNSMIYNQRPSSSNYNYNIRSSFENVKQYDNSIYGNKLNFYPDPLVSTSSTDLRHMRKNTMIYSTGADQFLSQTDKQSDKSFFRNKRQSIRTSTDGHNKHLDVPVAGPKLTKQSSYDISSTRRVCSSNSNSPSRGKTTGSSPTSDKLSKQHRKFSHDSQSQRKSIKSDKSIWSQAILSLKKKRAIFFGKRSKTRSTEKNNVDPVYHFLKCTANIDHNSDICECPCHTLPHPEILFHAHSTVNLPAIAYKSKHK